MDFDKLAGFFIAATGSLVVLLATAVFAFVTYKKRRERGFLLLFSAVATKLLAKVTTVLFFGTATFLPLGQSIKGPLKGSIVVLGLIAPVLALVGWIMLAWRKPEPNQPPQTTTGSSAPSRV